MTKVVITLENSDDATELHNFLKNLKTIKGFDVTDEDDSIEIDDELFAELERRSEEMEKYPEKSTTWEQIRTSIKNKHGI